MTAARLWLALAAYGVVAAATLAIVSTPIPSASWRLLADASGGACAGVLLFAWQARARPAFRASRRLAAVLVIAAAAEEVVWRRLVLGELLARSGPAVALGGSSVLFALAHRRRRRTQLFTGIVFGGVYLVTGLVGSVCAHAVYNLFAAGARARSRAPDGQSS